MFNKGTTWPPNATPRGRVLSGSKTPTLTDRQEKGRSASESTAVTNSDSRQTESEWEAVIDRATD